MDYKVGQGSRRLVFATFNPGKRAEVSTALTGRIEILSPEEVGLVRAPDETGASLQANATLKARHAWEISGIAAFADDSGLEVDALDGRPGVHSAYFAGPEKDDGANTARLLQELDGLSDRGAAFRTVICLYAEEKTLFFEGIVRGRILEAPRGIGGFGYDPVFVPEGEDRTFSEMSADEKNAISHRGKAIRAFISYLLDGNPLAG